MAKQRTLRSLAWGIPSTWSKDGERVSLTRTRKVRLVNKCQMKIGKCPRKQFIQDPPVSMWYHTISANQRKRREQTSRSQMQSRYHAPSEEENQLWNGIGGTQIGWGNKPWITFGTQAKRSATIRSNSYRDKNSR